MENIDNYTIFNDDCVKIMNSICINMYWGTNEKLKK